MAKVFTITGDDTFTVFGRVITDLADGAVSTVTFDNDFTNMKTGKNANTVFSKNETGNNANVTLRVMRGSGDDRFFQSRLQQLEADFPSFQLAVGEFVKRLGDGLGGIRNDVYSLEGGMFIRKVSGAENTDGETEQGVAVYNMRFAYATRSIR